ncbi:hypothetical protein [Dyadobacter bucti]|uniref:hypothetical protein n=1 Tax=Dyadobacter bucti TaxID=2572203 RepID=UPI003F729902
MDKTTIATPAQGADGAEKARKLAIIKKMKDDKLAMSKFFSGEVSIEEIHARGIKFIKPI